MEEIRAVHVGLGPLGSRIVRHIVNGRQGIRYVGAIDISPDIVGRDLGEVAGVGRELGVRVSNDPEQVFSRTKPDIAIYTTTSFAKDVLPQLEPAIKHGIDVITTCEQLAYPHYAAPDLAEKYDSLAKQYGVTVLGAGINPGFLMDLLPIVLTLGCTEVDRIEVFRRIDASSRRKSFQRKIGVSLGPDEFEEAVSSGKITGHVGLEESVSLIAGALGWELDEIRAGRVEPVVAVEEVSSQFFVVKPGQVKGLSQEAFGIVDGQERIHLHFTAYLGASPSFDEVRLEGSPPVNVRVSPCWHGDEGTVAVVVNLIPTVINASAGLFTVNDLVPISFKSGDLSRFLKS